MLRAPRSLQARLLLTVLGTSLAVWLAAAALSWWDARHELDELLDGHLAQSAALLVARQVHEGDEEERVDAPSLHRYAPRVAFQVFHAGRLVVRSANAPIAPLVQASDGGLDGFHTVQLEGRPWRVFVTHGEESDVRVFVGEQAGSREAILRAILRGTLWPVAVALPLLALAGWWAVRSGMQPLRALGGTLAARQPEALQPLALDDTPTEMRPMVEALNGLFQRIAVLIERERRFTGDAAHELRTPIAAIRAQAQVALGASDDAARQRALQATLAGCDRAARLVDQLLTLSRLEAAPAAAPQAVDLAATVRRVLAELAPASLRRRQDIALQAAPDTRVAGDETLLAVLARNLLDNAIRYGGEGARIRVRVGHEGREAVLAVEDSGPGLAHADLARLGQRFFRAGGADTAGSGLGWSIAERIVAAHGGHLRAARSAKLGGLEVIATLPGMRDAAMRK